MTKYTVTVSYVCDADSELSAVFALQKITTPSKRK